jgi:hypothetical protein
VELFDARVAAATAQYLEYAVVGQRAARREPQRLALGERVAIRTRT